jgi:hypothetical protein
MSAQPTHTDLFQTAKDHCESAITDIERELSRQLDSDVAEVIQQQEEGRAKAEITRIAVEREAWERLDILEKMKQDKLDIKAAECELSMQKQALHEVQEGAGPHHDDDEDDEDSSVSTPKEHPVCHTFTLCTRDFYIQLIRQL